MFPFAVHTDSLNEGDLWKILWNPSKVVPFIPSTLKVQVVDMSEDIMVFAGVREKYFAIIN